MVDHLEFIKQIGKGKYGYVYLVKVVSKRQRSLDNQETTPNDINSNYAESNGIEQLNHFNNLALKVINKSAKHAYATWKNEVAVMKRINALLSVNPMLSVPKLYDSWEDHKKLYILMDFIPGKNIAEMIDENTLTSEHVVSAIQSCKQLNRLGIKHRDFKPKNVIFDEIKKRWCIIDFGCSRITDVPVPDNYELFKNKINLIKKIKS